MTISHTLTGSFVPGGAHKDLLTGLNQSSSSLGEGASDLFTFQSDTAFVSASGSVCQFGESGVAAVAGSPRWIDQDLAKQSLDQGHAVTLGSAYSRYGKKFINHVSGPFSFVLIDRAHQRLIAGIDRLGLHSLYYAADGSSLFFGSTASSVLAQIQGPCALSEQGLYDYFYFHMVPSPQSVYTGLKKLPAAHWLEFSDSNSIPVKYWSPKFERKSSKSFAAMGSELKSQLRSAVERSLSGSARPGTFLSGGLDSSTVTGMLATITNSSCPAYAIGFEEEGYDEMAFARTTAKHFGVPLREYYVTPKDVLEELPTIATSYDEPFGNSSALPAYFCAKRAQEDGTDYLLAGDGGDEIFAGNQRYAKQQIFSVYTRIPLALRNTILEPGLALLPESFSPAKKVKSYIEQAKVPLPDRLQSYNYLNRIPVKDMFAESFLARVDTNAPLDLQRGTYHSLEDASDLSRMLYLDWQYTLADNDLRKVTQMCAVAGVGVRYPMLDEELVAFSCEIPDDWKLNRGKLRYFFKESLTGWLPDATINKKKQGFGLPFGLWMHSYKPLSDMANDSLLRLKRRGYFKPEFIDNLVRLHREEHAAYYGELIWILTVFDLWLEGRQGSSDIKLGRSPTTP
jgi:asparagine synthase (glutamine-hydrolysing)